jgi:excisionase family DNA binding protein
MASKDKIENGERLTVSVPEAGKMLGLGRNAAYDAAARGDLPVLRIGGRLLVPRKALERLLAGEEKSPVDTGP